jgi:pimeloyl-ACP methyl ester carboxylesterase
VSASSSTVEEVAVAVPGGELAVLRWPAAEPDAPVVLALHGITANGLAWELVARELAGRVTLLAPDLRGRAGSAGLGGPYGMDRHAHDAALVLRQLAGRAGKVAVAGHSMGAFVTTRLAVLHPELVRRVVLVDGGVGFPLPTGTSSEVLADLLGPALARLSMTFADVAAYRAFWRAHPAWSSLDEAAAEGYLVRDLTGREPRLRSACVREAVEADGGQLLTDPQAAAAVRQLPCPAELLWAERGLLDDPQGVYDEQRLAAAELADLDLTIRHIKGGNHYSILMGRVGAPLVAERILAAAGLG